MVISFYTKAASKAVNRTFFASLRFGVASPFHTKTLSHKKMPITAALGS